MSLPESSSLSQRVLYPSFQQWKVLLSSSKMDTVVDSNVPISTPTGTDDILTLKFSGPSLRASSSISMSKQALSSLGSNVTGTSNAS